MLGEKTLHSRLPREDYTFLRHQWRRKSNICPHFKLKESLGVVGDGLVDRRKVVEDEVLLDVADQLHQGLARTNLKD